MTIKSRFPVSNPLDSFWTATTHPLQNHRTTTDLPSTVDVLIIGSGYAGTATAYHLTKNNPSPPSILILEARAACSGATGRNGGHLKPDTYFNVPKYTKLYGAEEATRIAHFESSQVLAVKQLVEEENIDCDFHLTRAMDISLDPQHALDTEIAYRNLLRAGVADLKDVAFTGRNDAERISGVKGAQCCFTFTAGHIWPSKLVFHLLNDLIVKGINLQTHTPVTAVSSQSDVDGLWLVQTPRGVVKAKKVVFATNGYTSAILPQYINRIVPVRGICSHITTPKGIDSPQLPNTYSLRFGPSAYDYLIPRADGSIVVGGARSQFWHDGKKYFDNVDDTSLISGAENYFDGYMQRWFKGWEDSGAKTERVWTGIMGYSSDYMPHLGEVPERSGQFIIAGFSGHGMPQILLASKAVAAMIKDDVSYEKTGLPKVFKTTKERLTVERNELIEDLKQVWREKPTAKL